MSRHLTIALTALLTLHSTLAANNCCEDAIKEILFKDRQHTVSLKQAHLGSLEIDTLLLDSYGAPPANQRQFYLDARSAFAAKADCDFSHPEVLQAASDNAITLMGGPMLGDLSAESVSLWLRPATNDPIDIEVTNTATQQAQLFKMHDVQAGVEQRITLADLYPNTCYDYTVQVNGTELAQGAFETAPKPNEQTELRLAFGSDFHKIGVHNPQLFQQILKRDPLAMLVIGDNAVDDRLADVNMHRADYLLRDVSQPWSTFAANTPVYAIWDDHDYLDNDLSGLPKQFTDADRQALRNVWRSNWNNPIREDGREGIYFSTRIGPVEIFMLDTRSCRENARRRQYTSYLGAAQQEWLKAGLQASTAPFKLICSGTMWSDYVTKGKDSWGTWDKEGREELFTLIETENIPGVLLLSGDRHGARGFRIPRPSGFEFYEFECGTLGGVPGPAGIVKGCDEQLFGYDGQDTVAFGELVFNTELSEPTVTFRLIRETGEIMEEHTLSYAQLSPGQD